MSGDVATPSGDPDRSARFQGDGGAVLIEMAVIGPILLILLLAIFEFGFFFRDSSTANSAVSDGAKYGAIQGPLIMTGQTADYTIFKVVRENMAGVKIEWISRVVIFKAGPSSSGSPMAQVPAACKTSPISVTASFCNVYPSPEAFQEFFAGNAAYFRCVAVGNRACAWNPELRKNGPKVGDIEYLGVYVALKRPVITGIIRTTSNLQTAAIQRLEPGVLK